MEHDRRIRGTKRVEVLDQDRIGITLLVRQSTQHIP
jgi:hypothetical protein